MMSDREILVVVLKLLATTEDAQWNPEVKAFLRDHGFVENLEHSGWDEKAAMTSISGG